MARATSSKPRSTATRTTTKKAPKRSPAKATSPADSAASKTSVRASPTAPKKVAPSASENLPRPLEGSGTMHACWFVTLRVLLGWSMLWAFFDKLLGLGFATPAERAWLAGGSPTTGYLGGVEGTFAGIFNAMAGSALVDWLFMLGLLGVGISFVFGLKTRVGGIAGSLMLLLMYFAALPLTNNPIVDDHLVYAVLFLAIGFANYTHKADIVRNWWLSTPWVKKYPWCA